jgi:protein SCO1/2
MHGPYAALAQAAQACVAKGEECFKHCLKQLNAGDTSLVDCVKTVSAMTPICQALGRYAAINAKHIQELAALCHTVTSECEAECRIHADHHEACKACADACAACIEECNKIHGKSAKAPFLRQDFRLATHDGRIWASASCSGRPSLVFFGYTNCPDVCPTALLEVSDMLGRLGSTAGQLQVLFATVDPERDTPEKLREYLTAFDSRIVGLTGSAEEMDAFARAFGAYASRSKGPDYSVDHSALLYVLDRHGTVTDEIPYAAPQKEKIARLTSLIRGA